ncbi:Uncharacterized protein AO441_002049 [Nakaseomyces glabratus]|uniref:Uncharacterized protein n=1 Tax=Candida glabrata TaxID=5478 RepID=A0A0W0EAR2_CANGB|nr:hypothetical protein J7297_02320 [Nakaseomyces glabratus]KAH7592219.1 hypothetical protein J7296_02320 [Nakaseomyces glabratus]KAI8396886.1 hypothetical protein J6895_02341 [Nakaseomyces glabratus]KTA96335.1 Uncharacterized protein AO440_002148 [Nakaseomyces glabratus]KTB03111.1 Uncharacterized protein AO439_002225 [Nakaseomyces glabratus]
MQVVQLTEEFTRLNGVKDQAITKPVSLDDNTGEVVVRTSTGKSKIRKGQTEEEYRHQLKLYFEDERGPQVTEIGWLDEYIVDQDKIFSEESLFHDLSIKHNRQTVSGICHKLYYQRDYENCVSLAQKLRDLFEPYNTKNKIHRELEELDYMISKCNERLGSKELQ